MQNLNDSRPLISVVMAAYNMGRYLPEAVRSVLAQTYSNVEVQIIDDGSSDDTPAVCAALALEDARVRFFRQPNAGQTKAKNRGIEMSRGEFVAFLDADDAWLPFKLERQMPLFANPRVAVVYSDYECMDDQSRPISRGATRMYRGRISGPLLIENFVCFPSTVVRRECLEKLGRFDETLEMGIDYDLWLRMSVEHDFEYVEQPTVRYRIWGGQMSKNFRKRYGTAIHIMDRFLTRNPGLVDSDTVSRAWAHTYVGRGNAILWKEKDRPAAFRDFFTAIRHRPCDLLAWRSLVRGIVTTEAPR